MTWGWGERLCGGPLQVVVDRGEKGDVVGEQMFWWVPGEAKGYYSLHLCTSTFVLRLRGESFAARHLWTGTEAPTHGRRASLGLPKDSVKVKYFGGRLIDDVGIAKEAQSLLCMQ